MSEFTVKPLNITVVGDDYIGKSSLICVYATNEFPEDMDTNRKLYYLGRCHTVVEDEEFYLTVKAAPGEKYFDDSRIIWLANTDCYVLCYSISSRDSFRNIEKKWFPEIRQHSKSAPILLVGTMSDLRSTEPSDTLIKVSEGQQLAKRIQANGFIECSALDHTNIDEVFIEATKAIIVKSNHYEHLPNYEEIIEEQEVTEKKNTTMSPQKKSIKESGKNGKVKQSKKLKKQEEENTTENKTPEQIAKESGKNGKVKRAKKIDNETEKKDDIVPLASKAALPKTEEAAKAHAQIAKESGKSGKVKRTKKTTDDGDKKQTDGETYMKDDVALVVSIKALPKNEEAGKKSDHSDCSKTPNVLDEPPKRSQIGKLIKQFESENKF